MVIWFWVFFPLMMHAGEPSTHTDNCKEIDYSHSEASKVKSLWGFGKGTISVEGL